MIINNAGVNNIYTVDEIKMENFEWLININFWGVVYGTNAFLPFIKEIPRGEIARVINMSSSAGIIGAKRYSEYASSKFAVRGFTETLDIELQEEKSNVRAVRIHPGFIKATNIVTTSRSENKILLE